MRSRPPSARVAVLVDRARRTAVDLALCETEDDPGPVRSALGAMVPSSAASGRRTSVERFEAAPDVTFGWRPSP
jgi:hypothetical protein